MLLFKNHKAMTSITGIKEIIFGFFSHLVKSEQNGFTLAQVTLFSLIIEFLFFFYLKYLLNPLDSFKFFFYRKLLI